MRVPRRGPVGTAGSLYANGDAYRSEKVKMVKISLYGGFEAFGNAFNGNVPLSGDLNLYLSINWI